MVRCERTYSVVGASGGQLGWEVELSLMDGSWDGGGVLRKSEGGAVLAAGGAGDGRRAGDECLEGETEEEKESHGCGTVATGGDD